MVNDAGVTVLTYSNVLASHWIVPLVPTPPGVAPFCSVKNTAVPVPADL